MSLLHCLGWLRQCCDQLVANFHSSTPLLSDTLSVAPVHLQCTPDSQEQTSGTSGTLTGNFAHPNVCFSWHSAVCHKQLQCASIQRRTCSSLFVCTHTSCAMINHLLCGHLDITLPAASPQQLKMTCHGPFFGSSLAQAPVTAASTGARPQHGMCACWV